ncbi:beta-propeller domain-containing protein [Halomarina salina]|uniref:Beta-propeller domain-containing protein n=1 Tax=Halomarina salina TaxID=1872699 RepID=A0ABD5RMD2_9EURY|nr:beta-propeller domain-containing protein [Halomarina salina]
MRSPIPDTRRGVGVAMAVVVVVAAVGVAGLVGSALLPDEANADSPEPLSMVTSDSEESFASYLADGERRSGYYGVAVGGGAVAETAADGGRTDTAAATESAASAGAASGDDGGSAAPAHSSTNVQVTGIDEADVIKTDGKHIYYSGTRSGATQVIAALPADSPAAVASVPDGGRLFLVNETLVVIGSDRITGYDVSDPEDPTQRWEHALDAQVRTARLTDGQVYLVLSTAPRACPVEPVGGAEVACTDVLHPRDPMPVDTTYTVTTLDPHDGTVGDRVSFVGTYRSVVSMSENALYVTYTEYTDQREAMLQYLLNDGRSEIPDDVAARLEEVQGYDLSPQAEAVEVQATLEQWFRTLDAREQKEARETIYEGFRSYLDDRKRSLTTTHVVRVSTDDLSVEATGAVPGQPLDQFSIDEHDGHLRIATTVGGGTTESENDLYVLDAESLDITGEATGMGENERIYSVRFDGDRGYVVTFRQIDPYHVLDLSDPENPTVEGELKLPGVSTYLHPLGEDQVLGVGQEDGRVKLVVFDSSDPTDPTIAHETVLDARWSEAAHDHHAFLLDARKEVFFLPTETGGQVFDYSLDRVAEIDVDNPRRAVYIGDHLYVAGSELVVVDERTWTETARIELDAGPGYLTEERSRASDGGRDEPDEGETTPTSKVVAPVA